MLATETPSTTPKSHRLGAGPGRTPTSKRRERLGDEGQAFEIIKDKWTLISDTLADEALKAARSRKKDGKSLVATCTAAGIAYDKRWSKQVSENTEIAVPPSLLSAVTAKLLEGQKSQVMVQGKPCTEAVSAEPSQPEPDPALEAEAGG